VAADAAAVPHSVPPGEDAPYPLNLAEVLVEQLYPRYLERLSGCPCAKCRDDVFGIALNKVRPRYVPSNRLDPAELHERALVTETVTALLKAIFLVKRKPRHDQANAMPG
jgi:competence protein ComFB